jgi:ABC-2 type transport system permease protein
VLSAVPVLGDVMPGKLLGWGTALLSGPSASYWWALAVTVAVIGGCLALAPWAVARKDL